MFILAMGLHTWKTREQIKKTIQHLHQCTQSKIVHSVRSVCLALAILVWLQQIQSPPEIIKETKMLHSSPFGCFSLCCSTDHYTRYAYGSAVIAQYAVRSFFSLLTLLQIYLCISKHGRSLPVQLYGIMCETPIFSKQHELITLDKRLTYHNREFCACDILFAVWQ